MVNAAAVAENRGLPDSAGASSEGPGSAASPNTGQSNNDMAAARIHGLKIVALIGAFHARETRAVCFRDNISGPVSSAGQLRKHCVEASL